MRRKTWARETPVIFARVPTQGNARHCTAWRTAAADAALCRLREQALDLIVAAR
jgi:hypothetical protein